MNMTPQQVDQMSMWQFFAMLDAMADDGDGLSAEEADDLWEFINRGD